MSSVVAIMTRSPSDPRIKRRLSPRVPAPESRRELALAFLDDLVERCEELSGVFVRVAVTPPVDGLRVHRPALPRSACVAQRGRALGERLLHLCEDLAAGGFGKVVLLGSDLPDLPLAHLEQALALLADRGTAVVGPLDDGACYLFALRLNNGAVPDLFSGVRWDSPHALDDLSRACATAGLAVRQLPPWNDVDTPEDLDQLASRLRYAPQSAPRTAAVLKKLGLL